MRMRRAAWALLSAMGTVLYSAVPKTEPLRNVTKEQWRADLAYFARELPKRHMNAFHAVTREQFDTAVKELEASIATANDDAIVVGFSRIASMIGDGHTGVHIPPNWH